MQIIVLGMHRCGTSAVTRLVNLMGASLGDPDAMSGTGPDNERGFWEHQEIRRLNEELLSARGFRWDAPPLDFEALRPPEGWLENATAAVIRLDRKRPWVCKDPRMCLTLQSWLPVLESPIFVVANRGPDACAASLSRRNGFSRSLGLALWTQYQRRVLHALRGREWITVDYDALVDAPFSTTCDLLAELSEKIPGLRRPTEAEVQRFVDPALRHARSIRGSRLSEISALLAGGTLEPSADIPPLPPHSGDLLEQQQRLVREQMTLEGELAHARGRAEHLETDLARARDRAEHLETELSGLEDRVSELATLAVESRRLVAATRSSWRWRIGHAVCSSIELLTRRTRRGQLAIDRLALLSHEVDSALTRTSLGSIVWRGSGSAGCAVPRPSAGTLDFIVFPLIDWDFRIQRPQQLAGALGALGHRVFYLGTRIVCSHGAPSFSIEGNTAPGVWLITLRLPVARKLNIYQDVLSGDEAILIAQALYALIDVARIRSPVLLLDLPFWAPAARNLSCGRIIYDCMDHHAGFATNNERMLEQEERLIAEADLVVTTSERLQRRVAETRPALLVRNAADVEHFRRGQPSSVTEVERPRPVAGYLGAISSWFDVELVAEVARLLPDVQYRLVGAVSDLDVGRLEALPNVELIGEVPFESAPEHVAGFDVCLIPFVINELTLATNPVKVYEYAAAGRPVVATPLPELREIGSHAVLAGTPAEFAAAIVASLERGSEADSARWVSWAEENTWAMRADVLARAAGDLFPKVSVVVLCWDGLELTRACLKSLVEIDDYPNREVIIVDNGSTDGTGVWLQRFVDENPGFKLVTSETNRGFAGGNNLGVRSSSGELVVLLNNDTYVTRSWLSGLTRRLRDRSRIRLVGPVTNSIGNEARVDIHYADMEQMQAEATAYTGAHLGEDLPVDTLAFFCVAMSRQTYDRIGPLSEEYGRGFFEDDDYCMRVKAAGGDLIVAEDVFVHHHLSGSFDKILAEDRDRLVRSNRAIYEKRWGRWRPHRYRQEPGGNEM